MVSKILMLAEETEGRFVYSKATICWIFRNNLAF